MGTINRQTASECEYWDSESSFYSLYRPSAESELPFEIQDILDYLDTVLHPIISPEHWNVYSELYDMISMLPSAERHGRWIPVDSYSAFGGDEATWMAHGNPVAFYYCSECKEQAYAGEDGESLITDYCPNCGAKMRVGK